eukprot:4991960-Pyramimonas_sp.AAC.1
MAGRQSTPGLMIYLENGGHLSLNLFKGGRVLDVVPMDPTHVRAEVGHFLLHGHVGVVDDIPLRVHLFGERLVSTPRTDFGPLHA